MEDFESIVGKANVKHNEPMSKHTSFKVGGNADIYIMTDTLEKVQAVLKLAKQKDLPITVIGNGTNLLVSDEGIRGVVLKYTANNIRIIDNKKIKEDITLKENKILDSINITDDEQICIVDGGAPNGMVAMKLLENELSGFEFAAGIPGSLAGAVYMNAGAFGGEMKDIVTYTKYIDMDKYEICTTNNEEHKFSYRSSVFQDMQSVIVEVGLKLHKQNKEEIENRMNEYRDKRLESQPLDKPSAGSTFKRGEDFVTAKIIDEAGLKGYKIGGAEVSAKHAGFIINSGNATADDVKKLIEHVQKVVYEKFGKMIQTEIKII